MIALFFNSRSYRRQSLKLQYKFNCSNPFLRGTRLLKARIKTVRCKVSLEMIRRLYRSAISCRLEPSLSFPIVYSSIVNESLWLCGLTWQTPWSCKHSWGRDLCQLSRILTSIEYRRSSPSRGLFISKNQRYISFQQDFRNHLRVNSSSFLSRVSVLCRYFRYGYFIEKSIYASYRETQTCGNAR